jgi:hypothetical protein
MMLQETELTVKPCSARQSEPNCTLDDAIELLEGELERLKVGLEAARRLAPPRRDELVRWHVRTIDRRQDALEQLQAMLIAGRQPDAPIH